MGGGGGGGQKYDSLTRLTLQVLARRFYIDIYDFFIPLYHVPCNYDKPRVRTCKYHTLRYIRISKIVSCFFSTSLHLVLIIVLYVGLSISKFYLIYRIYACLPLFPFLVNVMQFLFHITNY